MRYIEGYDRKQIVLYPEKLDDLVAEDNPVRLIDEFVNQLDFNELGILRTKLVKSAPGAPCYSPECLLKLYIYGYYKRVRSSRRLMEICTTNIEVMWLLGRLKPDFRTIADFRKENKTAMKKVFKAFVKICVELGLYNKEVAVQDGSKFRAVNAKDKNVTESKLEKKIEIAEERISKYLEEMDKNDKEENDAPKYTKEEIQEKIRKLRERKAEHNKLIKEMKEEGITQQSFTDPESRLMLTANGGYNVCYNVQIAVDPSSHIIGAFEVTNQCNDMGLLTPVTTMLKEDLDIDVIEVVADKGYEHRTDMLECLLSGTIPHIPSRTEEASYEFELGYKEAMITEELLDSTKPEDIKACLESGIVPSVYRDKGIEASIYETEQYVSDEKPQACFRLNEDGTTVTCPNGSALNKVATLHNKGKTRFVNKSACKNCTKRCTTSAFKQVDLKDGQTVLHTTKHQRFKKIVKSKKVILKLTPDKEKIRNRKCVVEHPFGTTKRWQDGSYTLLIGKEKVSADIALILLSYNMKRVINTLGIRVLLEKMRERKDAILSFLQSLIILLSQSASFLASA